MDEKPPHREPIDESASGSVVEKMPASTESSSKADDKIVDAQQPEQEQTQERRGNDGDNVQFPTGLKLAVIIISLCLSVFLVALDQTIIAPALGEITEDFESITDIGWYGAAYLLTIELPSSHPTARSTEYFSVKYTSSPRSLSSRPVAFSARSPRPPLPSSSVALSLESAPPACSRAQS